MYMYTYVYTCVSPHACASLQMPICAVAMHVCAYTYTNTCRHAHPYRHILSIGTRRFVYINAYIYMTMDAEHS